MHATVDINGKHATKAFEDLFREFTDEIALRIKNFPIKVDKMRQLYRS